MINKEKELKRLEYENIIKHLHMPRLCGKDIYSRLNDNLNSIEKYREYSLSYISKEIDKELYDLLKELYLINWYPSAYQISVDMKMISNIETDMSKFYFSEPYIISAADIIIYFAKRIQEYSTNISFASSCEILLTNIGLYPNPGDKCIIKRAWNDCAKSNELPFQTTMFDQEYYDISYEDYDDGTYFVPSWSEQLDNYILILNQDA